MDAILTAPVRGADPVAEAHHRIANSLTLLSGIVRMQALAVKRAAVPLSPADAQQLLEGLAARINTIARLHRLLSQTADGGAVPLLPRLVEVADALVETLSAPERPVAVRYGSGDGLVPARQLQPIALILSEIFINAMKHAHPGGAPLVMTVDCEEGDEGLALRVSDDGIGLPAGARPNPGMGFRVMESLAAEIGARLGVENGSPGLTYRLALSGGVSAKLS